jgi:hypothetical protein
MREQYGNITEFGIPFDTPMVFAFDPGKSTGWALWSRDPETPWLSWGQGVSADVLLGFRQILCRMSPATIVASETVIERYTIPSRPTGKTEDIAVAFEVIGAIKMLLHMYGLEPPKMQLPVERTITSNKLLYSWGWLSPNQPRLVGRDATSAVQHLGSYLLQKNAVRRLPYMVK